ncbi:PIG-L deacetylase family protein [Asanoa siamensis]|uniref:1D-myo-inositol 2-acetamido-2-deoxy-alpha-D-glucopyranoside deacetylase n=1 Tax=Asanoa siamensis TaxID=926357 RepID=A0ABQ4CMK6_9ACTN|nr:PIG-L family deacetylase [Asanoa siamensis]GIF72519.1 1D-myo-inositol 2-acetamido-2-deoxy-alpha-D-glucopyranoside deacetylase [Asanoa siamensis]
MDVDDLGTIVSIWAHPDDESYLAGGVMAAAVAAGSRVVCVSATAGERGTDDPVRWPPERLGPVRRWEAAAALAVLGVREHHFLGYSDGSLAGLDPAAPVGTLTALLDDVRPDTILTFGPEGMTFHPDHQAVSRWVSAAWAAAGRPGRLLHAVMSSDHLEEWGPTYESWQVFMTEERPTGVPVEDLALHLVLDGTALDQKIAALAAMHTQTAAAIALLGDAYRTLNAAECFVAA